jgi:hypothetical protein
MLSNPKCVVLSLLLLALGFCSARYGDVVKARAIGEGGMCRVDSLNRFEARGTKDDMFVGRYSLCLVVADVNRIITFVASTRLPCQVFASEIRR